MSECVMRMEMPKNCAVCPFVTQYSRCVFLGMYAIDEERRADNCPIICQLPEGHGRLVDADALRKNMFAYAAPEMRWDRYDIDHKIWEMPTIVPAEPPKEEEEK